MASVPLAIMPQQNAAATSYRPAAAAPAATLSALEWSIVAFAERDTVASLREPGRFAAALNSLFGLSRPNKLADPRLEALRRVAVYAWRHGWNTPKSELKNFVENDFSHEQFELILASIHKSRQPARSLRVVK